MGQAIYPAYKYVFSEMKRHFRKPLLLPMVHNDAGHGGTTALYAAMEGGAEILELFRKMAWVRAGIASLAEVSQYCKSFMALMQELSCEK